MRNPSKQKRVKKIRKLEDLLKLKEEIKKEVMEEDNLPLSEETQLNVEGCKSDKKIVLGLKGGKQDTKRASHKRKRADKPAFVKGKDVLQEVKVEHPVLKKTLLGHDVSSGGVRFPISFTKAHLPDKITFMVLETESGECYEVKYLPPDKSSFCAGWPRFVRDNKLVEGDTLVFQLVEDTRFKVQIIRANHPTEAKQPIPRYSKDFLVKKEDSDAGAVGKITREKTRVQISRVKSASVDSMKNSSHSRANGHSQTIASLEDFNNALNKFLPNCQLPESAQPKLNFDYPVLLKSLLRSESTVWFWLNFPKSFSGYLPNEDTTIVLETGSGECYKAKYLPRNLKLSAGWRRFALDKKLAEGDILILHLIEDRKFKIDIIRASTFVKLRPSDESQTIEYKRLKRQRGSANSIDSTSLSRQGRPFEDITNFEEFTVAMEDLLGSYRLPLSTLHTYFELCCHQRAFLHAHIFKGINPKLINTVFPRTIKSIICKLSDISCKLKNCKLSDFIHGFGAWDAALSAYLALGMDVEFMSERLRSLKDLAFNSEGASDRSRYKEAVYERGWAEYEVRKLDGMLKKLRKFSDKHGVRIEPQVLVRAKEEARKLEDLLDEFSEFFSQYDAEIETWRLKAETHENMFSEKANAPW